MILTTHALIGAAIANAFPSELHIGLPFAFLSHYLMDIIPHTNYGHEHFLNEKNTMAEIDLKNLKAVEQVIFIVLDIVSAILLVFLFFVRDEKTFLLSVSGAFLGVLPDVMNFLRYRIGGRFFILAREIHDKFHYNKNYSHSLIYGVLTQFGLIVFWVLVSFLAIGINS